MKPESLLELISKLKSLPGISKKQSERIAYYLIQSEDALGDELANSIIEVNKKIVKCEVCHHLTENNVCGICEDKTRKNILVVVESPLDVFKFEDTQSGDVYYHVIDGLINVSRNIELQDLNIESLKERAPKYKEVIIALSPTLEGIVTANYIKELLKDCKVTQLAQGIPLGAAMEYVDELTLKAALDNRKEIK